MPIRPENVSRYPKDWKRIREEVLERAGHACERCRVGNYWFGYWDGTRFVVTSFDEEKSNLWPAMAELKPMPPDAKGTRIVLTIAHLDHTPENNGEPGNRPNLQALCQRCHLAHDHPMHMQNSRETRRQGKAVGDMFDGPLENIAAGERLI